MRRINTDILIVGAGGAGLRAALSAFESSPEIDITVISRGEAGRHGLTANACSDRMAFHATLPSTEPVGANAWKEHAKDIYEKGRYVSDPNLAELLAKKSGDALYKLIDLGVPFVKDENGIPDQFVTDGSEYARACYTGPYTARDIENATRMVAGTERSMGITVE